MRILSLTAGAVALIGSALALPAATEAANAISGIPGYLDPVTGAFTTRTQLNPAATAKTVGGTITVTTTVLLDSTIPVGLPLNCSVSISASDDVAYNSAGGTTGSVRSGSKATCTTTITFLWQIDPDTTKAMTLYVNVQAGSFGTAQSRYTYSYTSIPLTTKTVKVTLAL